jgi:cytochrome b pre-mRNA-processing protein 3
MFAKLARLFGANDKVPDMAPLYAAIVAEARQAYWYVEGGVADTMDGRFEAVSAVLGVAMARLEAGGEAAKTSTARLAEQFVTDIEGQYREAGIGDAVIGKYMGQFGAALGGRLGAYRDGLKPGGELEEALRRNLYAGDAPSQAALAHAASRLRSFFDRLTTLTDEAVMDGRIGQR